MAKLFKQEDIIRLTPYKKRGRGRPSKASRDEEVAYYTLKLGLIEVMGNPNVKRYVDNATKYLGNSGSYWGSPKLTYVWVGKVLYHKSSDDNHFEVIWDVADILVKGEFETDAEHPEVICQCGCADFRVLSSGWVVCMDCKAEMSI